MILTTKLLNKLLNGEYIKKIYPMIDHIDAKVVWDGDETDPLYAFDIEIFLNDEDMNTFNMYERGMDPHYLVDIHMMYLLKFVGISSRDITDVYFKVIGPDDSGTLSKIIHPKFEP